MDLFKRKSADHALKELVDGLSAALGPKLLSVVVYGSKASGEFREGHSNVNVFILLVDAVPETLERMRLPLKSWADSGHVMPVFVAREELQRYADSLPIEFLDMQDHHQMMFGDDPIKELSVSCANLRAQCTLELSVKLLKLRQAFLMAEGKPDRLRKVLTAFWPGILTLYRAALRLETNIPAGDKLQTAKELATRVGIEASSLERLWDYHIRRQTDDVEDVARQLISGLEHLTAYLHRK